MYYPIAVCDNLKYVFQFLHIKFHVTHNLNFHISDCHTLQLRKQKKAWFKLLNKANSVIVENNPQKEQNNVRKAWFKY